MTTPGIGVALAGAVLASLAHRLLPGLGVLTWAVLLGVAAANLGLVPAGAEPGLRLATRRLLRVGIVLLGLSLSLDSIAGLGAPVIGLVAGTLLLTLTVTIWLGRRLGVGRARSLLIATGFAICGASAIAAMETKADGDEEDVTVAIAMVTLFGSVAMVLLPLLQRPLGLSDTAYGAWAGASVQEIGQVVAAAGPAGAAAVGVAVVVKLTRVLLLAPVVAAVGALENRGSGEGRVATVPLFVLGFLACVVLRSTGLVPDPVLAVAAQGQTLALGAALVGMGAGVRVVSLVRGCGPSLLLAGLATLVIGGASLAWVRVVA
ncbi:MAG: putative sulfate exporter family transporter [Nocardioidaceae bacterium]|nr:putative sulfate exporter family transporter [Nocardioidaceae bacterium]